MLSDNAILHFNLHKQEEVLTEGWLPKRDMYIGITAGASCPNNLIDDTIRRLFELRGVNIEQIVEAPDAERSSPTPA
jgi:4-hydroxy-3-methylbut-2-enyl diphosphate reductase